MRPDAPAVTGNRQPDRQLQAMQVAVTAVDGIVLVVRVLVVDTEIERRSAEREAGECGGRLTVLCRNTAPAPSGAAVGTRLALPDR